MDYEERDWRQATGHEVVEQGWSGSDSRTHTEGMQLGEEWVERQRR